MKFILNAVFLTLFTTAGVIAVTSERSVSIGSEDFGSVLQTVVGEEGLKQWCCNCCGAILKCDRNSGNSNATISYDITNDVKSRFNVTMVAERFHNGSEYTCCCCCGSCLQCQRIQVE